MDILCGDYYVFKVDVAPGGLPMRSKNEFFFFGFLLYIPNYLAPGMESIFRIFEILGFLKFIFGKMQSRADSSMPSTGKAPR